MSEAYDMDSLTDGYFCPVPKAWDRVYQKLMNLWIVDAKAMPEPPRLLILAGWNFSTPEGRQERWKETVMWARDYGVPVSVVELAESEKFRG